MLKVAAGGASGSLNFQGTWDASTNTPTLTSGIGTKGYYYVVSVAGNTNLDGVTDWQVGDWAVFNGVIWQKVDNTDLVQSVNGQTGVVVLGPTDVGATPNTAYVIADGLLSGGGRLTGNVTVSLSSVPVANVPGAVPNTTTITAGGLLSGGGNLASNVTISLVSVPLANVAGAGTMAAQNADNVAITGGTAGNLSLSNTTIDGAAPYIQFANGATVTVAAGRMWYDGSTGDFNLGMGGGNITQQIGEELYRYGKASVAITDSPLKIVYKTGVVGASGNITFAPTIAGITDPDLILGCATENITIGNFGRITTYGVIHGITTDGVAYGETWVDGDDIWYNPVTGNPTKVKPVAPYMKLMVGTVINAAGGGAGSFIVKIGSSSTLGGTDSNVQLSGNPTNNSFLTYDSSVSYWKDVTPTAARTSLGLGTISTQDANNVAITGGTISGVNISTSNVTIDKVTTSNLVVSALTGYMYANGAGNVTASATIPVASVTGAVPNTVTITAGTGLTGGGNLSANLSLAVVANSTNQKVTIKNNGVLVASEGGINLIPGGNVTIATADDSANNAVNVTLTATGGVTLSSATGNSTFYVGLANATSGTLTTEFVNLSVNYNPSTLQLNSGIVGATEGIIVNAQTNTQSYSIPSSYNAMTAGPFTVANSTTITVPDGSVWTIV